MASELNFTARLDTSQFLSQIDQARTQFNLAFSGGGGFGGAFQQMANGLSAGQALFGGTFTNPAIAYSPFFGAVQATTQLDQEWAVHRGGYTAAMMMKPPGVSAAAYAMGVESNFIDRQIEARHAAGSAARTTLYAGIGGMAGGEVAGAIGGIVGSRVGAGVATRFLGAGAAGAGRLLGGLAGSWFAFDAGMDFVGGKIERHFAEVEQIGGYTRELGELAGAGRGLKRGERYELGVSARSAAKDLNMDVQEMGEILALGRQAGMLPNSTDPNKFREQVRDFARSIEEGAQILGTSLSGATQVIKAATSHGMSAREGIIRAAGAGGPEAFMGQLAQGAMIQGVYSGMANGPLGNMQLMAAMGGGSLNMGMMDLPGAALSGLTAGGGDMMSNMGRFMVHRDEYMRGIGPGGARTMARAQIQSGGEMMQMFMPELSDRDAQSFFLMSQGLDPKLARTVAGGGGGGKMTYEQTARAALAMQEQMLGVSQPTGGGGGSPGISFGRALQWGVGGALIGGNPISAVGGAVAGFVSENWGNISAIGHDIFSGNIFDSAQVRADRDQRQMAAEYEAKMSARRSQLGLVEMDQRATERFLRADLSSARLNGDAIGSPLASQITAGMLYANGLSPVAAGAGTMMFGGVPWRASDVQRVGRDLIGQTKPLSAADMGEMREFVEATAFGHTDAPERRAELLKQISLGWNQLAGKGSGTGMSADQAGAELRKNIGYLIEESGGDAAMKKRLLNAPIMSTLMRESVSRMVGEDLPMLEAGARAALGGGAAMAAAERENQKDEAAFLRSAFGGGNVFDDPGYVKALMANPLYARAKGQMVKNPKLANKTMRQAVIDTHQKMSGTGVISDSGLGSDEEAYRGAAFRNLPVPNIDVTKPMPRTGAADAVAQVQFDNMFNAPLTFEDAVEQGSRNKELVTIASEMISLKGDTHKQNKTGMGEQWRDRRGQRSPVMEKAVGFGEQETALATINRALKSTERSLKDLSDKIGAGVGKGPAPSSGGK